MKRNGIVPSSGSVLLIPPLGTSVTHHLRVVPGPRAQRRGEQAARGLSPPPLAINCLNSLGRVFTPIAPDLARGTRWRWWCVVPTPDDVAWKHATNDAPMVDDAGAGMGANRPAPKTGAFPISRSSV